MPVNPHHVPPALTPPPQATTAATAAPPAASTTAAHGLGGPSQLVLVTGGEALALILPAVLLALLAFLLAGVRGRLAPGRAGSPGGGAGAAPLGWRGRYSYTRARMLLREALASLQRAARAAGARLPLGATVWETARAAGGLVVEEGRAERFAASYDELMYGPREPGMEEASKAVEELGLRRAGEH